MDINIPKMGFSLGTPSGQPTLPGQPARLIDTVQKVQEPLAEDSPSAIRRYGVAALCVVGAVLLRLLLDPVLGPSYPVATIFGFVGLAVWYGGWGPACYSSGIHRREDSARQSSNLQGFLLRGYRKRFSHRDAECPIQIVK